MIEDLDGANAPELDVRGRIVLAAINCIERSGVQAVTVRDIAGLYIFDNTLEAVVLTGAQVEEYLEASAKYFEQVTDGCLKAHADAQFAQTLAEPLRVGIQPCTAGQFITE